MENPNFKISFLITGNNPSGGIRVTVMMGNELVARGHDVRILYKKRMSFRRWLVSFSKNLLKGTIHTGWLHLFRGKIVSYSSLKNLLFSQGEIVIGVGTYVIPELYELDNPDIIKIRSNHGIPFCIDDVFLKGWTYRRCWNIPMKTITVSNTLVPRLESLCGHKVSYVIPNGINTREYFPEKGLREGVGTIYANHPNKAPQDVFKIMQVLYERIPHVPQYCFGTSKKPAELRHLNYCMLPSVCRARSLYNRCKIWMLASYEEGFPAPVLEAMACGCVVVSSNNDGSLEIIKDGYNGIIVPKGDVYAFVASIESLLNKPEKMRQIRKNAYQTVAKYTWENAADKMEGFLQCLH